MVNNVEFNGLSIFFVFKFDDLKNKKKEEDLDRDSLDY